MYSMNAPSSISRMRLEPAKSLMFVVCLAQFMVILDVSIVNVALPAMHNALHFSTTGLQWVVNAYTLTFAGLLMLGGRCVDLLGARRVFLFGTALFAGASLACALADTRGLLIVARALQGVGGAVVSPATLGIITRSFAEGPERNRAVGMWGAMGALGASSGVLLGGILTQAFGWAAIFAVNVPLGAIVLALGPRAIPAAGHARERTRHFDVTGAVLVTASLVSLTFGIVRTDTLGWGSAGVLAPLAAGVALLIGFLLVEGRFARAPLVPLSVFKVGHLRAANLVVVLLYAAFFPVWFFLTLYLQQVLHYDAIEAGIAFLPMTLSIFAATSLAPRAVARFGAHPVIAVGMLSATIGMLALRAVAPGASYFAVVLPGALLTSIGMGFSLVPATITAMQGLPRSQSGLGSGLLNTSRLMGGAIGLAVLSTIAATHTRHEVAAGHAQALTDGFGLAFTVGALFCLLGTIAAAMLLRPSAPVTTEPASEPEPEAGEPAGRLAELDEGEVLAA